MNEIEELLNWIEHNYVGPKMMIWEIFLHDMDLALKTKDCETLGELFFSDLFFSRDHAGYFFSKLIEAGDLPENLRQSINNILLMDKMQ